MINQNKNGNNNSNKNRNNSNSKNNSNKNGNNNNGQSKMEGFMDNIKSAASNLASKAENITNSAEKSLNFQDSLLGEKTLSSLSNMTPKIAMPTGIALPAAFTNSNIANASKEFMESNTMITKFVFILLLLIVFILLLRVLSIILINLLTPSKTPILLNGLIDGRKPHVINVDPNRAKSKPIYRSSNKNQGVEFTWNLWIFIDDIYYESSHYRHIFHKGDSNYEGESSHNNGISYPNNAPGMYLAPGQEHGNRFVILFNTYEEIIERVEIDDVPIEKWICVTIRCQNKSIDVYINGVLTKRHTLKGVPKQNYGNVYVTQNRGFGGYVSELRYFDYAIYYNKIKAIKEKGPNLKMIGNNMKNFPPYLRTKWFYENKEYS